MDSVHQIVREAKQNYLEGMTHQGKYVDWSMYNTVETVDAYLNSKHISGLNDSLGREKPFFNIVTAATNIWYRATDIDRKDIKILPNDSDTVLLAFLATEVLRNWMNKNRFGTFLNLWGRSLARYGSSVVKFVEQDGELIPSVIPWNRFIADPIDFDAIPRIERFYKTPAQLKKMKMYDQQAVKDLIKTNQERETLDGQNQDNQANFIELYEVHGELPSWYLDKDPQAPNDDKEVTYRQQMHVVTFIQSKEGKWQDFTLYKGKEKQDPYMITHLIPEDGRTLSIGSVEYLFDAQWMQNHTMKQWKDQLDLASKLIFQTADQNYVGKNVLTSIETGQINIYEQNKPLTLVNNQGHDIGSIQGFLNQWKIMGQEITNTPDLTRGITQAQPVTYGLGQIMNANSNSLFEIMIENKSLDLEDMLTKHIIPHLKTKLDNKDEIVTILDANGVTQVDTKFIPIEAVKRYNKNAVNHVIQGGTLSPYSPDLGNQAMKDHLSSLGNMRMFKPNDLDEMTWKEVFKDLEWKVTIEISNENKDKASILTSLTTLFQTLAQTDPAKANFVLGKILSETGVVSPIELANLPSQPLASQPVAAPPTGATGGGLSVNQ